MVSGFNFYTPLNILCCELKNTYMVGFRGHEFTIYCYVTVDVIIHTRLVVHPFYCMLFQCMYFAINDEIKMFNQSINNC